MKSLLLGSLLLTSLISFGKEGCKIKLSRTHFFMKLNNGLKTKLRAKGYRPVRKLKNADITFDLVDYCHEYITKYVSSKEAIYSLGLYEGLAYKECINWKIKTQAKLAHKRTGIFNLITSDGPVRKSYVEHPLNKEVRSKAKSAQSIREYDEIMSKYDQSLNRIIEKKSAVEAFIEAMPSCSDFYARIY